MSFSAAGVRVSTYVQLIGTGDGFLKGCGKSKAAGAFGSRRFGLVDQKRSPLIKE